MVTLQIEPIGSFEVAYEPNDPDLTIDVASPEWSNSLPVMADPKWADPASTLDILRRMILYAQTCHMGDQTPMIGKKNCVVVTVTDRHGSQEFVIDSWSKRRIVCEILERYLIDGLA